MEVPEYQPLMEVLPLISPKAEMLSGVGGAPRTMSVPLVARPPCVALIAALSVTVARMTLAPPSLASSVAGFCDWLSM